MNDFLEDKIKTQRAAISELKREIFGIDKTFKSRYIRDFHGEFKDFTSLCTIDDVIARAADADVVYFGDYHPLRESQEMVVRLMREFTGRGRKVVLAMEMLYEHQQVILDRWMKGEISEEDFLEEIDYYSEWGFNWESYRKIFLAAKDPFIPVFGIDSEPREHLIYIRKRDTIAARRIANILKFFPGHLVLVVIGESHLASSHLPSAVRRFTSGKIKEVTIVQNIDEIYWKLLREGKENTEAVLIDERRFCIFTASPIIKYQSYMEILDRWIDGRSTESYLPVLEQMVETLVYFLNRAGIESDRDGRSLMDAVNEQFPEVICQRTYTSFNSYLRRKHVTSRGVLVAREGMRHFGLIYMPEVNSILVMDFNALNAAREAARFIYYVLQSRVGKRRRGMVSRVDRFYTYVLEEAIAQLGGRILDPAGGYPDSYIFSAIDSTGVVREPFKGMSLEETRKVAGMLKYHLRRERTTRGSARVSKKILQIVSTDIKKRFHLVRALGFILGDAIFNSFNSGKLRYEDIARLFSAELYEERASFDIYFELSSKTKSYRFLGEIIK